MVRKIQTHHKLKLPGVMHQLVLIMDGKTLTPMITFGISSKMKWLRLGMIRCKTWAMVEGVEEVEHRCRCVVDHP